jgi:hypothetical protein
MEDFLHYFHVCHQPPTGSDQALKERWASVLCRWGAAQINLRSARDLGQHLVDFRRRERIFGCLADRFQLGLRFSRRTLNSRSSQLTPHPFPNRHSFAVRKFPKLFHFGFRKLYLQSLAHRVSIA